MVREWWVCNRIVKRPRRKRLDLIPIQQHQLISIRIHGVILGRIDVEALQHVADQSAPHVDFDRLTARAIIQQEALAFGRVEIGVGAEFQAHYFHPIVVEFHIGFGDFIQANRLSKPR